MNVDKLLEDFHSDRIAKGLAFEELAFLFYQSKFDEVIKTDKMDKGIDLILFNHEDRLYRIGVQIKNQQGYVTETQIVKMVDRSIDYYGLSELWLLSTSEVKYSAKRLIAENNIVIKKSDIPKILEYAYNIEDYDTRDIRKKIYDTINKRSNELGVSYNIKRRTVYDIMKIKPKNTNDLYKVHGFGKERVPRYGNEIIKLFK